ncbi:nitrogen regulatory protein PII 2 [Desulfohalotomaculum tongense]|uniref:P-II family nitrogen regulator n=1 Tax=Desulforadius tongensis TaxID=1216062 RepID=UPI001959999B|nr:nitrogen regulatory protein PII 2 [Desulforadius tongensis]
MKEIVAVIRTNKMTRTKEVLSTLGFPAMTACKVMGRGKQKGLKQEVSFKISSEVLSQESSMRYIPKRLISLVVNNEDVSLVVEVITRVNRTGEVGDGRIFVCPVEEAVRVRTQERGREAIC